MAKLVKNFYGRCPSCGDSLRHWQTVEDTAERETVDYRELDRFLGLCTNCGTQLKVRYQDNEREIRTHADYHIERREI